MVVILNNLDDEPIHRICGEHGRRPDELIEILHTVQKEHGYLTDAALRTIAEALNISRAEIHGVVSFYHDFYRAQPARHILKICRAEACQAVGSDDLAAYAERKFATTMGDKGAGGQIGIEAVYCLGNCALGPAMLIDGKLHGRVTPERLDILAETDLSSGEARNG